MLSSEQRAILGLLALAVLGHGVRHFATRPDAAPGDIALLAALPAGSPTAHRDSARLLARPLEARERIDVDRASAAELARLPRVGPSLAKAIVADRTAKGPFGGLEGLDRVSGIGPGLLRTIGPHASFSGRRTGVLPATAGGTFGAVAGPTPAGKPAAGALDLNTATVEELDDLPGVGKARALAIVRYRDAHGKLRSAEDLDGVPGLGRAQALRIWASAGMSQP